MPAGTPVESTAAVLHEMGAYVAGVPEVTDYEAYAGTASPINFNGLVRQYYLRSDAEQGDLQVNLVDKHERERQSHEIAAARAPGAGENRRALGRQGQGGRSAAGPAGAVADRGRGLRPGRGGTDRAAAERVREAFAATPDIVGIDDSDRGPRAAPGAARSTRRKAALLGVRAARRRRDACAWALAGEDVTPICTTATRSTRCRCACELPAERQGRAGRVAASSRVRTLIGHAGAAVGAGQRGQRTSATSRSITRTCCRWCTWSATWPAASTARCTACSRSAARLAGIAAARRRRAGRILHPPARRTPIASTRSSGTASGRSPTRPSATWALAYAVGLILIYLLVVAQFGSYLTPLIIMAPIPLTIIGVMPGHALLGRAVHRHLDDRHDRARRHHRAQLDPAGRLHQPASCEEGVPLRDAVHALGRRARQADRADRAWPRCSAPSSSSTTRSSTGLAISLIFGILVSTLLTLVVIPVLYYVAMKRKTQPM